MAPVRQRECARGAQLQKRLDPVTCGLDAHLVDVLQLDGDD